MADTTTEQTSITRLAPYREEYEKALMASVLGTAGPSGITGGLVSTPIDIPEQKVAPVTQETLDAYSLAKAGLGQYLPYMQQAEAELGKVSPEIAKGIATAGYAPGMYAAGTQQYDPTAATLKQYMDPYQQLVTDEALKQMDREAAQAQNKMSAEAVKAGAFGGGREGVQRAELARNLQDIKSQRIAEDLSKNYQQALTSSMSAFDAARQRQIAAGQGLTQAGIAQAGLGETYANLANQLQGLAGAKQGFLGQDVGVLESIGSATQQQQQMALDAARQTALQQAYEPYQRMGYASDLMRGLPTAQTTVTQASAPTASPMAQALGAGMSGMGIYGILTQQPWATGKTGGGIFNAANAMMGGS